MMRISFILPPLVFDYKIQSILEDEFPKINYNMMYYKDFSDVPALVKSAQEKSDAIIFGGTVPYEYACKAVVQNRYWAYIPRAGSTILCALLNAVKAGWNINRLSFDTYSCELLKEVYEEIGYFDEQSRFITFKGDFLSPQYVQEAFAHHKNNIRSKKADGCITSLSYTYQLLKKEHIPAILVSPTRNVIREQLHYTQQLYLAKEAAKGYISVLYVSIGFPPEHSVIMENDERFMLEKMNIVKQIYKYAGQLQGTVVEVSLRDYILFTTKDIIELETKQYQVFHLLNWSAKESIYPISIGIGHGESVAEAKKNAVSAMLRAQKHGQSAAYVLMPNNKYIGPLMPESSDTSNTQIDSKFNRIAEKTGLSVNSIYNLYCFIQDQPREGYTSQELAEGLQLSKRSMDRILQKLDSHGYVQLMGTHIIGKSGRPSRVLKIKFDANADETF